MTMTIPENTAAPDFGAEAVEPVDYPRILYVCEHCQKNVPEMCGRARDDLYVTPSGQWLCDECIDEEGVPISDCVSPPALYPASTVARLQQEIQRLTAAELAEVMAERDAAREYAMQARLREKAAEDARVSAVSRASRTEVALAEARKALEASASALEEAREDVEHWGSYAGEYFQNKHDLEGDLDRIAKQASAARRALTGGQEE